MKRQLQLVRHTGESVGFDRLTRMGSRELNRTYQQMFGGAVPAGNMELARRKIAWQAQADNEGGLPVSVRDHAIAIAKDSAARVRAIAVDVGERKALAHSNVSRLVSDHDSRIPLAGSVIVKEHRGRTILVRVLDSGFELDGQIFSSLSAIAKVITGTKWNGMLFFGLTKGCKRGR